MLSLGNRAEASSAPGSHSRPSLSRNMGPISENSFLLRPYHSKRVRPPWACRFPSSANMSYADSIKMVGDVQSSWKTENAKTASGALRPVRELQSRAYRLLQPPARVFSQPPGNRTTQDRGDSLLPLLFDAGQTFHVAHENVIVFYVRPAACVQGQREGSARPCPTAAQSPGGANRSAGTPRDSNALVS